MTGRTMLVVQNAENINMCISILHISKPVF